MPTILIVAAHPDDEVLGCGGTILVHRNAGDTVKILFLSEGVSSRGESPEHTKWTSEILAREEMARKSASILDAEIVGFERIGNLRMRDMSLLDVTKNVLKYIEKIRPDVVYTHHPSDLNTDHRITFEAVFAACRPTDNCNVKSIRTFEVPSSTDWASTLHQPAFRPETFVDITAYLNRKIEALLAYAGEMRQSPHPRSEAYVRALATIRGGQVGLKFAEGFVAVKNIVEI